ncbi:diguanylate cyclase domain-containing protein [Arenimonas oryziterrae]|uniref:Diguanylate cyclase n=1 Tax=Arenimonas oryziterrae DSM 21050 = YC6267 TaxID=1121015 RepID=A0A091ALY2_9GAMM|nr:diguanylate cyclase [Arenimonas oryziterrae]KFN41208.1 hypothetical protein N789_04795 [Arenimonas oryziterrae DSM 21050 = YC6267]
MPRPLRSCRVACWVLVFGLGGALAPLTLAASPETATRLAEGSDVPRHALEARALIEPEAVLQELPAEIAQAKERNDSRELALLYLAQANACRVVANWSCQRDAGAEAHRVALIARQPILVVRGLIAESRASIAMQDFTRGEQLLGDAQVVLKTTPSPELSSDVYLAYSSLSYSLGKHALAAQYADRGLAVLKPGQALPMQVRLLRNRSRAESQLGLTDVGKRTLAQAQTLAERVDDPKLSAELYLEWARQAHLNGDVAGQKASGEKILKMADRLKNSQLVGLGHEVLGVAAGDAGDLAEAERELRIAQRSFRSLNQGRDELRVLRELVGTMLGNGSGRREIDPAMVQRFLELEQQLDQAERAQASDDFDARLKYAEREVELVRLKGEALLAQERAKALTRGNQLTWWLIMLGAAMVVVLAVFLVLQRRSNRRLGESEQRYRVLADNSSDMVVRMRPDGRRLYVSPSAKTMLGREPAELMEPRWDLVHPDDRATLVDAIRQLTEQGGTRSVTYRAQHADGHYVWIEALARSVPAAVTGGAPEIIYSGRNISARVRTEQALAANQKMLRAITDNIPALIAYIDTDERYGFANALYANVFGMKPEDMIGHTVRETVGDALYSGVRKHAAAALRGERETFEGHGLVGGQQYHYQANYVPDIDADGKVHGFFALTFDITKLKLAEIELEKLARFDSLTGIANRRQFDERLSSVLARSQRHHTPVVLLYVDIDHFKSINDSYGHSVGDGVMRQFATRLKACVRDGDLVARLGGDEFAVLIDDAPSPEVGDVIASKLMLAMQAPMRVEGVSLDVGASVGIAFYWDTPDAESLMAAADEALYSAKAAGRRTFRLVERD